MQDLTLTYDAAGNVKTAADSTLNPQVETATYTYDTSNRLKTMTIPGVAIASYDYNAIGNMTRKAELNSFYLCYSGVGVPHPHAAIGTSASSNCSSLATTYRDDANGNMTSSVGASGNSSFSFDAENRLKGRSNGTSTIYTYDGNGALLKRTNSADGSFTVYVGGIYEKTSSGAVTKYYAALGRAFAMRTPAGVLRYLLTDQVGSTVGSIDHVSGATSIVKYWPYGDTRWGAPNTDKAYTGQQQEPGDALGLYFYHARFYSTTIGRFASADPTSGSGLNRYSYVSNSPLTRNDPTGYFCGLDSLAPIVDFARGVRDYAVGEIADHANVARAVVRAAQPVINVISTVISTQPAEQKQLWRTMYGSRAPIMRSLEAQFAKQLDTFDAKYTVAGTSVGLAFDVTIVTGCTGNICTGMAAFGVPVIAVGHTIYTTLHDKEIANDPDTWKTSVKAALRRVGEYEDLGDLWLIANVGEEYVTYLEHTSDRCSYNPTSCRASPACQANILECSDQDKETLYVLLGLLAKYAPPSGGP